MKCPPGAQLSVRLACGAGDTADEGVLEVPEHRVLRAPDGQERLVERLEYPPRLDVLCGLRVFGSDGHEGREGNGARHVIEIRERRPVSVDLGIAERTCLHGSAHECADIVEGRALTEGEPAVESRAGSLADG